jgi:hypothetical protein
MLFSIPFLPDWNKIRDYRQHQTYINNERENRTCKDWDIKSAIEYCYGKMVSSTNQKAVMNVILGLSLLFT